MPPEVSAATDSAQDPGGAAWTLALAVAATLAVDPAGLGGCAVRAPAGPVRERWQQALRAMLPPDEPLRRVPLHVGDGRLLGGLDLTATLAAGRPVAERGLLAEADGGMVVLPMAERISPSAAGRIAAAMDTGEVLLERDGLTQRSPARFGVLLYDEGGVDDDKPPAALLERAAFRVDLWHVRARDTVVHDVDDATGVDVIRAARERLGDVTVPDAVVESLVATAVALGVASLRAAALAVRAARASCALAGRHVATNDDATFAAAAVLAPRATRLPVPPEDAAEDEPAPPEQSPEDEAQAQDERDVDRPLDDVVLDAAVAAIPAGLLAALKAGTLMRPRGAGGRAAQRHAGRLRGRPLGSRRGTLRDGSRLNVVETLRAAAPWQPLRAREAGTGGAPRVHVRPDDFRIVRFKQRTPTTTIFVVDASGSAALHRLAEAKGAVELLLADCYVRRDRVALIAFRGRGAELVLPATRSLARARRCLAGVPGGGGTPLAAGIDCALELATTLARRGDAPALILLTDGRANVARDGAGGRPAAERDALAAARAVRSAGIAGLVIDTSPRPDPAAERLSAEMGARYLPLPHADARGMSAAAQAALAA